MTKHSHKTGFLLVLVFFCLSVSAQDRNPLFSVEVNGKHGFIDRNGQIVIDPQFEAVGDFSEGLARYKKGEKWGFIDRLGRVVIKPRFLWAHDFSEGLARVQIFGPIFRARRSIGFINKRGAIAIRPQFDELRGVHENANGFHQGLAMIELDYFKGFIDGKGRIVIAPVFETPIISTKAWRQSSRSTENGVISIGKGNGR